MDPFPGVERTVGGGYAVTRFLLAPKPRVFVMDGEIRFTEDQFRAAFGHLPNCTIANDPRAAGRWFDPSAVDL